MNQKVNLIIASVLDSYQHGHRNRFGYYFSHLITAT